MSSPKRRPRRKRVVLASRRNTRPVAKAIMELEEQTSVGEVMVTQLVRTQLRGAVLVAGAVLVLFSAIPLVFWMYPALGEIVVFGIRLPWLMLGVLPYPVLLLAGYAGTRNAERHEREFLQSVEES